MKRKEKKLRLHTEKELEEYDPKYLLFISVRKDMYFSMGWRTDFSKFVYPDDWDEQKALNLIKGWLEQDIPDDDRRELETILKRYSEI